LIKFVLFA